MGCHTWFSDKIKVQPTFEDVKKDVIDHYITERGYYERHVNGNLLPDEIDLFSEASLESSEQIIIDINHYIDDVMREYDVDDIMEQYAFVKSLDFCRRNHLFYRSIRNFHDVFRIGGYPEDELLSMDETLEFIENNINSIDFGNRNREMATIRLEEFWREYPDGRIDFG